MQTLWWQLQLHANLACRLKWGTANNLSTCQVGAPLSEEETWGNHLLGFQKARHLHPHPSQWRWVTKHGQTVQGCSPVTSVTPKATEFSSVNSAKSTVPKGPSDAWLAGVALTALPSKCLFRQSNQSIHWWSDYWVTALESTWSPEILWEFSDRTMFEHVSELRTHAVDKEQISEFASVVFIVYCDVSRTWDTAVVCLRHKTFSSFHICIYLSFLTISPCLSQLSVK